MKKFGVLVVAAALLLVTAPLASAWGPQGHSIVGAVADAQLTPAARAEVSRLLAGQATPTLAGVANWADQVRPSRPNTAPWHYADIAENNCQYVPAINGDNGNNVIEAIRNQAAILGDTSKTDAERQEALKFVVHFVGDIHQPMHDAYARDRGGNDIPLTYNGRSTNLHSVWDSGLLNTRGLNDTQYTLVVQALPAPDLGSTDPVDWAQDTCHIAVGAYPNTSTIGTDYTNQYRPIAEAQLRLAGDRLARLINETLS
ncbi:MULTISPECIES: S1/P1 nuclease [Mycobacteroides]|uniref:Endonuclease n=1 Tax=Mycobacteroides chelonae TaxID=1774 RepID=A0A1S1LSB5_MYCCH|nr:MULTISPECIES: S1/P1 nuclease [Mycobacteroides]KRQ27346.1 endonuclease [Mycobacteroides sp. H003]KRQ36949.1 endonuclease [Mycobacteroides sp. H092]KRQ40616.1 endonuclease [Mycobacteroides sp. H101]KRQ42312.1 endonuclease [Mycobacteroides sp. H063]KRQ54547.1 endonuclease [Mycobacteroides sp. HXVII]